MTDFEAMQRAVKMSEEAHGGAIDFLVCNAGYAEADYFENIPPARFQKQIVSAVV